MSGTHQYLVAIDFDGTSAATFEDSSNGMNVHVASNKAIAEIFGSEGVHVYEKLGGLMNRDPGELITIMLKTMGLSSEPKDITELYIQKKLSYLIPEVSPIWPRLYPGVKQFFLAVGKGELPIDIAIISSGHDSFIQRVFDANGIPQPNILVTSDIIQSREMPRRARYKPFTYQLAEAHRQWEGSNNIHERYVGRAHGKSNMIYIGDDEKKDGGLAEQARIPFLFVPFTNPDFIPREEKGQLLISDFVHLRGLLTDNIDRLTKGESFSSILFGKGDDELFRPLPESEWPYRKMIQKPGGEWASSRMNKK